MSILQTSFPQSGEPKLLLSITQVSKKIPYRLCSFHLPLELSLLLQSLATPAVIYGPELLHPLGAHYQCSIF